MKTSQVTLPARLNVLLKNAVAVQEMHDYLEYSISDDLAKASQTLIEYLNHTLPHSDGWGRPQLRKDVIVLQPGRKWKVTGKDSIDVRIRLTSPADQILDAVPYVSLYVPVSWRVRKHFVDNLKVIARKHGWIHISDPEAEGADEAYPLWKYIRYESFVGQSGFDPDRFFAAISEAVSELQRLESEIDRLIINAKTAKAIKASARK